ARPRSACRRARAAPRARSGRPRTPAWPCPGRARTRPRSYPGTPGWSATPRIGRRSWHWSPRQAVFQEGEGGRWRSTGTRSMGMIGDPMKYGPWTRSDLEACIKVLEAIVADRGALAHVERSERLRLLEAAGRVSL